MAKPKLYATTEAAIIFATVAHQGQTDKAGAPYILHCLRVGLAGSTEPERVCGFLHDTVEDTATTLDDIRTSFGPDIADTVDALTHRPGEPYTEFIERCGADPVARRVKLNDLRDNMDTSRLPKPMTLSDWDRIIKYNRAWEYLYAI